MADDSEVQYSAEDEAPVESLIKGRAKRSTAGRLMSSLLDAEADDDLALLFEEVDDDNEFDVGADQEWGEEEDMGLDSSSDDDDDQGPNARDDYEGEKQIEKEEKAEKRKRRAQQDLRIKIASKKVKIDPTAVPAVTASRPKKKSERISWIPTPEDGPTRSSSRRQTMQNKELTHARLKDSEEKRVRLIATMEEAAKRKAQFKPKEMTQAERLAEAERVETLNSKSLNRWEEMEKRKAEERRAKIEALQNRRLEGPVMSYWSGVATWINGRLMRLGKVDVTPKLEKEDSGRRKSKKLEKEEKNVTEQKSIEKSVTAGSATSQTAPPTSSGPLANPAPPAEEGPAKQNQDSSESQQADSTHAKEGGESAGDITTMYPTTPAPSVAPGHSSTPAANDAPAADTSQEIRAPKIAIEQQKETTPPKATAESSSNEKEVTIDVSGKTEEPTKELVREPTQAPNKTVPNSEKLDIPEVPPAEGKMDDVSNGLIPEPSVSVDATSEDVTASQVVSPAAAAPDTMPATAQPNQEGKSSSPTQKKQESPTIHVDPSTAANVDAPELETPQPPPVIEHMGRNLTVLENFDDKTAQSREFSIYFNAKKPPRLTKISSSLCVITSLPSRYRDPETSLPFANAYAYHEIRHTVAQKYAWSPMLGCYVGPTGVAARGVPERFLGGPQARAETEDGEKKVSYHDSESTGAETDKEGKTKSSGGASNTLTPAPPATPTAVVDDAGDPMEVDNP
ncbi:hypothetical protein EYZ11_001008 [Aspergillus tanneri]|uniref:Vps72/YL1 C-terminal domain-containing protein n=1 Tax=Aspergillus tanneri TaxID=1220188 RepID=A0A4S3JVS2_9EURO|nr:uncharacterized protein ATNIH1004_002636 [Aspergillus tanneri]KAA8649957.1 hypothetical protein ATNIH1004_002636 [Aspergillus tanneri]THC99548.1 hypothetical protein EYZ11_001008 [Aspergillus tanneri]